MFTRYAKRLVRHAPGIPPKEVARKVDFTVNLAGTSGEMANLKQASPGSVIILAGRPGCSDHDFRANGIGCLHDAGVQQV